MGRKIYGAALLLVAACGGERGAVGRGPENSGSRVDSTGPAVRAAESAAVDRPLVLFLGTSLTAGLGVDPDHAWPAQVQRLADSAGLDFEMLNGGVSGETSAGALRRLPFVLREGLAAVVIETGANDGLRGIPPDSTRANIAAIISAVRAHDSGLAVVLAGMEAPPNMGPRFTGRFRAMFPDLAREHGVPLIPFLLEGVGGVDSLNQADGIHPTRRGHAIMARTAWLVIEPVLRSRAAAQGTR